MPRETIDIPQQQELIRETTDLSAYRGFVRKFFSGSNFLETVAERPPAGKTDGFRLLTGHGLEASKLGFNLLEGQMQRHKRKKWERGVTSAPHVAAALVYMAEVNKQVYPIKQQYIDEVLNDPKREPEVWGYLLTPRDGKITATYTDIVLDDSTSVTTGPPSPIVLPHIDLSERLATDLSYLTGEYADKVDPQHFAEEDFPKIKEIYNKFAPIPVFPHS